MRWLWTLFGVYLAAVLTLTMWPVLGETPVPGWAAATVTFLDGIGVHVDVPFLEAASNVVMFVPFGILGVLLLADARRRWPLPSVALAVALAGVAFSAAIETVQRGIPGRFSTLADVLHNGGGALAGAAVTAVALACVPSSRWVRAGRRQAGSGAGAVRAARRP